MFFKVPKLYSLLLVVLVVLVGCESKKVSVKKTPEAKIVYNYEDKLLLSGYPKHKKPWIVYADKDNVSVYPDKKYVFSDKKIDFGTPLIVLKQHEDLYKVVEYEPKSIVNNKIEKKKLKKYGWVHKDDLLLWDESIRNEANGFRIKSVLSINNKNIIVEGEKFIDNDSIIVYKEPALITKSDTKLPIGDIVYIYKFSDGNKKALIGNKPLKSPDDEEAIIYGWIDTQIVSLWNQRATFKLNSSGEFDSLFKIKYKNDSVNTYNPFIKHTNFLQSNNIDNLFALEYSRKNNNFLINFFDNISDYSENKVYNVLGGDIYFNDYKKIIENSKKINIAFIIDASSDNLMLLSSLKSIVQELDLNLVNNDFFTKVTYTALFYNTDKKNNKENVIVSDDYNDIIAVLGKDFLNSRSEKTTIYDSTRELNNVLQSKKEETNLVIVVGNKIDNHDRANQSSIISNLSDINSKLIFFQLKSDNSDTYNDFVLFGESALANSAKKTSESKKKKLINQEHVIDWVEFDLSRGDKGIYRLDFPTNSMIPGAIVFPKKGEQNRTLLLKNILTQTLDDIVLDNTTINNALFNFFKSPAGVAHTKIKDEYKKQYNIDEPYIPVNLAMQLLGKPYAFMHNGYIDKNEDILGPIEEISYGALLDEDELEQVKNFYLTVHSNVFKSELINNRLIIRRYIKTAKKKTLLHKKTNRKTIRRNTMDLSLFLNTGLYNNSTDSISVLKLNKWKRRKILNPIVLVDYFESFKTLAEKISDDKGKKDVLINHNGVNYYWLDNKYLPHLDFSITTDSIKSTKDRMEQKGSKNEYINRVKKGLL